MGKINRQAEARGRHAYHYLERLRELEQQYDEGGDNVAIALSLFDLEWEQIQKGRQWAEQVKGKLCLDFAIDGAYILSLRQLPSERVNWLEFALTYAEREGHNDYIPILLNNLGVAYRHCYRYQEAITLQQQALTLCRDRGLRKDEGACLGNLGSTYASIDEYDQAASYYRMALAISQETNSLVDEMNDLTNLASVLVLQGQIKDALSKYHQALNISKQLRHVYAEGIILGNVGQWLGQLGRYEESLTYLQNAKSIVARLKDKSTLAMILMNLGNAYSYLDKIDKAIDSYQEALNCSQQAENRFAEALILTSLGSVWTTVEQYEKAHALHQQAIYLSRIYGHKRGEAVAIGNLGNIYFKQNNYHEAIAHYRKALSINAVDTWNQLTWWENLGLAYVRVENDQEGLACYKKALEVATVLKANDRIVKCLEKITSILISAEEFEDAIPYLKQLLHQSEHLNDQERTYFALNQLIVIHTDYQAWSEVIYYRKQAVSFASLYLGDEDHCYHLGELGNACGQNGQYEQSMRCYQDLLSLSKDLHVQATTCANLGSLTAFLEEYQLARDYYNQALVHQQVLKFGL